MEAVPTEHAGEEVEDLEKCWLRLKRWRRRPPATESCVQVETARRKGAYNGTNQCLGSGARARARVVLNSNSSYQVKSCDRFNNSKCGL
jgi:hypothetical protein